HDSVLTLDKAVKKARFADIRASNDCKGKSLVHHFAIGKRISQFFQWTSHPLDTRQNLFRGKHGHVVLGKINTGLYHGNQVDEGLLDRLKPFRKCSIELLGRNFGLIEGLGLDEITHSFSLGQIKASIEE